MAERGLGTAGPIVRVGVILPLSGPLAVEGNGALRGIADEFATAKVPHIVLDDRGALPEAFQAIERLVSRESVSVVIGPITSAATEALAMKYGGGAAVIISLTTTTRDTGLRLRKSNPSIVTFSSISREHLKALEKRIEQRGRPRRVALVVSNPAASAYVDEIVAALGESLPRHEAPLRALLSRSEDVAGFVADVKRAGVDLVTGMVSESIAGELTRELRRGGATADAMVFSPPPLVQRGRAAARLVTTVAARNPDFNPRDVLDAIRASSSYDVTFQTLAANWTLTDFRLQFARDQLQISPDRTSCLCVSKDGSTSRRQECLSGDKCGGGEADGICHVMCTPPPPLSR
jgi:ABC-type branched-subunit amino acid transport system substrate-binding protein